MNLKFAFIIFALSIVSSCNTSSTFEVLPTEITKNTCLKKHTSYYAESSVNILKSVVLTIEQGVDLTLCDTCSIYCDGQIVANGSEFDPIYINTSGAEVSLYFKHSNLSSTFKNTHFTNTALFFNNSEIRIDSCSFKVLPFETKNKISSFVISSYKSNVYIENSSFLGNNLNEGLGINKGSCLIRNNKFLYLPDAIELSNLEDALITGNKISYSNDDGIDLNNCKNIIISYNNIEYSKDKGISIGSKEIVSKEETIRINHNLITNNKIGIAVKLNSLVDISNCILEGNSTGLAFPITGNILTNALSEVNSTFFVNNENNTNTSEYSSFKFWNCYSDLSLAGKNNPLNLASPNLNSLRKTIHLHLPL